MVKSYLEPEVRNMVSPEIKHQYLSVDKAREILGWKPLYTMEKGLDQTAKWYREFL